MKKALTISLALMFMAISSLALAGPGDGRDGQFRKIAAEAMARRALNTAPAAGDGGSAWTIALIPEFHYTHHGGYKTRLGGTDLKSDGGTGKTVSFVLTGTRPLTDYFTIGFIYQYAYSDYRGGLLTPDLPIMGGRSDINATSHMIGLLANFDFKEYGRLETSIAEAWDIYNGSETMSVNGAEEKRSVHSFDDRVFSFLTWYSLDFSLSQNWKLSPYLGWRSVHVVLNGQNDWGGPAGSTSDDSAWAHLASLGLKASYQSGLWGFYGRAGVNHRVSRDDIPGLSSRAVAPGVTHLAFMTSFDRTIGTWGLGLNYVIPGKVVFDLGYNGFAGSDINGHTVTLAAVFPF
jgi:hypothetical protein